MKLKFYLTVRKKVPIGIVLSMLVVLLHTFK